MSARVADNPHKPGTPEHRQWEERIHCSRFVGSPEYIAAKAVADARLAALKASLAHVDTTVDDLLDEMARVDQPDVDPNFGWPTPDVWPDFVRWNPWDFINLSFYYAHLEAE